MNVIGVLGGVAIMVLALALAGLTVYSGWQAVREELVQRNFRSQPPGLGSCVLTLVGLVLPVIMVSSFLVSLAAWLGYLVLSQFIG